MSNTTTAAGNTRATKIEFIRMMDDNGNGGAIYTADIIIRDPLRRFLPQFYCNGRWIFALPVQTMYLQTYEGVLEARRRLKEKYPDVEVMPERIAEIRN